MNKYSYHIAKESEANLLSILFRSVYIDTYATEGVTDEFASSTSEFFSIKQIKENIENENCMLWVAKFKGNPVGVLQLDYEKKCPVDKFIAPEINKLYILRQFRKKGIGKQLLKIAESHLSNQGHKQLWLWVLERNRRATGFYLREGYKNIGTAYLQLKVNNYKNTVMKKKL